jgi:hypothetical protein
MTEFVEDDPRLPPSSCRGLDLARSLVRLTEAAERHGLVVTVTVMVVQLDGFVVAGSGLRVVAEMLVCVPDAVPRIRLPVSVTDGV